MRTNFESYKLSEFNSLFEIPVYRVSPNSFENELQKELDRICNPLTLFENLFPKNSKEKYEAHRHELELHIGYLWKFNEIVGWVLLNIDKEIFSGELFYKEGKRIMKGSKSKINYRGESFRFDIVEEMTDLDIYSRILTELKGLTKKSVTKGRYIDTNRFETIGKYINWRKMFEYLND
ncbi:MAG TPA: hypothetical protein VF487_13790 [Chitinophagaceae bacterium]